MSAPNTPRAAAGLGKRPTPRRPGAHRFPTVPLDVHLAAWIAGIALAALLCLMFGDHLALWAGVRP